MRNNKQLTICQHSSYVERRILTRFIRKHHPIYIDFILIDKNHSISGETIKENLVRGAYFHKPFHLLNRIESNDLAVFATMHLVN